MGLEGGEVGGEGEGSGVKGGGKWGERGREVGVGYPPVHPLGFGSAALFGEALADRQIFSQES